MGGEWKAGRGGATLFLQCQTSHKLRYRWLHVKPYLCRVLHPIHRVLGAGFVVGPPMEVNLAQPVGPAERPPGQHWKPKQRKTLHCRNGSRYTHPLTSHQTSVFGQSPTPPHKLSQMASHFFEVLQKPSLVQDMTFKIAFMCRLVGYGPLKGMVLSPVCLAMGWIFLSRWENVSILQMVSSPDFIEKNHWEIKLKIQVLRTKGRIRKI